MVVCAFCCFIDSSKVLSKFELFLASTYVVFVHVLEDFFDFEFVLLSLEGKRDVTVCRRGELAARSEEIVSL